MNPLITTQAGNRKVNLMNQNITDRHEEQEEIPRKIECRDHLFIRLHYRKISHSPDLWADAGLSSLMINRPGWSEEPWALDVFFFFKGEDLFQYYPEQVTAPVLWYRFISVLYLCFLKWKLREWKILYNCNPVTTVITAGVWPSFVLCLLLD